MVSLPNRLLAEVCWDVCDVEREPCTDSWF